MTPTEALAPSGLHRPRPERHRRDATLLWLLPVVFLLAIVVWRSIAAPRLHGDSTSTVQNASAAVQCLRSGQFTNCPGVGYRALLQYLPAMLLYQLGVSADANLRALIALNAVSFVAIIAIAWMTARRLNRVWAPVVVAVLLMGPLQWYASAAFSEALTAAVVIAAIAAVLLQGRPSVISALVALACLGKETNLPFVVALALLCLFATPRTSRRRGGIAVVVGGVIGAVLTVGFDYFRFGSFLNKVEYLPVYHVPNHGIEAKYFASLWIAPNGGIAEFWPAMLIVLGLAAFAVGAPWRRPGQLGWRSRVAWAVLVLLFAEVAGLATWYSPFGWYAWGPRLVLPLFPAMLLVSVLASGPRPTEVLERALASTWIWLVAMALALAALPNYAVSWYDHAITRFFIMRSGVCFGAHVETTPHQYYRCNVHLAWARSPVLWHGLRGLQSQGGAFAGLCLLASVFGLTVLARQMTSRGRRPELGSSPPTRRASWWVARGSNPEPAD